MVLRNEYLGVLPPRLLQDHSPSGDSQCMDRVGMQASTGDQLVNGSAPFRSVISSSSPLHIDKKKAPLGAGLMIKLSANGPTKQTKYKANTNQ